MPESRKNSADPAAVGEGWVIGIDVGGTKIAAGLIRGSGEKMGESHTVPSRVDRGGAAVLDDTVALAAELASEARSAGHAVRAIGLGLCELVDRGGEIASANCVAWLDQPVRPRLSAIAPRVVIEADVRAAARAEAVLGAGRAYRSFLYATVGTGISCCLVQDGNPYLGARGLTGTMGSSPVSLPCGECGRMAAWTLEDIASGPALVLWFNARGGRATGGREVLDALERGDPTAVRVVGDATEALGSQLGLLVNVLDPEALIVGGGLGSRGGRFWELLEDATRRHVWSGVLRGLPMLRAGTGADAGWLGAALAACVELTESGKASK